MQLKISFCSYLFYNVIYFTLKKEIIDFNIAFDFDLNNTFLVSPTVLEVHSIQTALFQADKDKTHFITFERNPIDGLRKADKKNNKAARAVLSLFRPNLFNICVLG